MTREESAKFLAAVKLAYPMAYSNAGEQTVEAAVNMWSRSFGDSSYRIVCMAFDRYRMRSQYPPTVAEIREEIGKLYYAADDAYCTAQFIGNQRQMERCLMIMQEAGKYRNALGSSPLRGIGGGTSSVTVSP